MQLEWLLALTLALSPEEREQAMAASGRLLNRELNPACGRFSFSPGEKAGMRAGVILNCIVPAQAIFGVNWPVVRRGAAAGSGW